jgi:glycosyltransferase involved in cell wall biosynthesis
LRLYSIQTKRKRLLRCYRAVAVPSRYLAEEMKKNGVAPDRIAVTPLPPTELTPQTEPPRPRPPGDKILLAGRLTALKGGDLLLEAIPLVQQRLGRRLSVTFMGDGPERHALERLARALAVRCTFLGWLQGREREAVYRDADLLALPSIIPESYGLSGLEAACFGTPTVAFDLGGVREWLEPGVGGVLADAPPANAVSLAEAIVRALRDGDSFNRLRRGAWQTAHRFSMEAHVAALESVLASVART